MITTAEVIQVTSQVLERDKTKNKKWRMNEDRLENWRRHGVIRKPKTGQGKTTTFTMPELVAVTCGARLARSGLGPPVVQAVFDFLSKLTEEQLLEEFKAGNRIVFPIPGFVRLSPPSDPCVIDSMLDIEATYHELLGAVARMEKKTGWNATGRNSGLATAKKRSKKKR